MAEFGASSALGGGSQPVSSVNLDASLEFSSFSNFVNSFGEWVLSIPGIFLLLALIQGFFAGVVLGKLAEGDMKSGLRHSLIMMTFAFIVMSFAQSL